MTCLIDRVLSEAEMKLHSPMLETFFVYTYPGTMYADFQEKIFAEISGKMFQTFLCSNVTTMESWVFPSVCLYPVLFEGHNPS